MATITSTSERIIIDGGYKDFTAGSGNTTTVIQYSSGDAPVSGDAERFLLWKNGTNTGDWEIRFIESATSSAVTITDGGFSSVPSSSDDFVISTSLEDIRSAVPTACTKTGNSYSFNDRDFELSSGAFLADTNKNLTTKSTQTGSGFIPTYPVADGCALQFGRLIGGEANDSIETIGGSSVQFEVSNNTLIFTNQSSFNANGPILNFYGCLIESFGNGFSPFIRSSGPMRIIGTISDGPMGGRLYSPASELVDTRFSGNLSGGVAWSLGATFTRPINNVFFFQNNTAIKAFQGFQGVFSNTTFADSNTNIINSGSANSSLLFTFIDCTTFLDAKITDTNGNYKQAKSINYTITDSSGVGKTGAKVAVYDTTGAIQDGIKTSSSGAVDSINAVFFDRAHGSTSVNKAPFDIDIRLDGYTYLSFQSAVSEPIKQEVRLSLNPQRVDIGAAAAAITGISLNFTTKTITITSNNNTQKLYDYYQYQLYQIMLNLKGEDLIRTGDSFNLDDWDMVVDGCTYTGDATTTGLITLINGAIFQGTRTDQNGTVIPLQPINITNIVAGSRLQIFNVTTNTETVNTTVAGTSYVSSYTEGVEYTDGDTVRVRLTKLGKSEWSGNVIDTSNGFNVLAEQVEDEVYTALGVDGSTVTKFQADYTNNEIDLIIATNWTQAELYAWWTYNLTSEDGIRNFYEGITAIDQANFRINTSIVNLFLDNVTTASYIQTDNRRFFRDTGDGYPVKTPTTSGYGLDVVWRTTIIPVDNPALITATTAIQAKTDLLNFTGDDVKATLDGEEVVTDTASRNASKADVSGLSTFDASTDEVTTDVASRNASKADVSGLSTFDNNTETVTTDTASRDASKADVVNLRSNQNIINEGVEKASLFIPHKTNVD